VNSKTWGFHCETWYSLLWVTSPASGEFLPASLRCLSFDAQEDHPRERVVIDKKTRSHDDPFTSQ